MFVSRRYKTITRAIVSILIAILITQSLELQSVLPSTKAQASEVEPAKQVTRVKELTELRTENKTEFLNSDGTKTALVYNSPIRYKDKNGELKDIDNTIVETTDTEKISGYKYKNKGNKFDVYFPADIASDTPVHMVYGKYSIDIGPTAIKKDSPKIARVSDSKDKDLGTNSIYYDNTFEQDDSVQYIMTNSGYKENIILNSYTGQSKFYFSLRLKELIPVLQENGQIFLNDKTTGETVAAIPKAYMYDSATGESENISENVSMDIESIGSDESSKYLLTITADPAFLQDKSTVYPVTIDPTVRVTNVYQIKDSYVQEKYPTSNNYNDDQIRVGQTSILGRVRTYINFDLPSINGGMITNAKYNAYQTRSITSSAYVYLARVNNSWTSSTITWYNAPAFSGAEPGTTQLVNRSGWFTWDITDLVSDWYSGAFGQYGFVMRETHEYNYYRIFNSSEASSNTPYLEITYSDKPAAPSVSAYGNEANSSTGYVNLSWNPVAGAAGYKVAVFNGLYYEYYDVGNVTSWTSKGKGIWPTTAEVQNGRYQLHHEVPGQG
jgi:hypothetical protein